MCAHAGAVRPCFLRKRPMEGRLRVPLLDRIHCFGFPDGADDGVRTRGLLLGKQACCHCTTSALRGVGFEPTTSRSWAWRATELPYPAWPRFPGDAARQGRVPDGPQGAVPGRRREGARVCGPTVAAKHAMEESNLRGRFWRPSDCHCPNGVLCFPLFDCQTSPPASGVRPRAAACDGMRPRRGGHPLRRVASHGRARRRPARRPGACLSAGMPRTAMRPPTHPIRPARRAPATGRRRPCPEARTPRTAAPPRTPSFLRKP